jgi:hypothetical protein
MIKQCLLSAWACKWDCVLLLLRTWVHRCLYSYWFVSYINILKLIFLLVYYLLSALLSPYTSSNWNILRRGSFPLASFYVALFLLDILLLERGVCSCWASSIDFFRFSVIRKQALMHFFGIKQTQKLTRTCQLYLTLDFLPTLFAIIV